MIPMQDGAYGIKEYWLKKKHKKKYEPIRREISLSFYFCDKNKLVSNDGGIYWIFCVF